ncbi:hypothetical protein [Daejeonella lutea]|uniref:Beta-lactamase-inhibitor-like, PepSY-like n=1 Tax=Daejeonella lutea TaxID=572036 RepID=A0A1T5DT22_9SPHI|nr:hypothetical protein [Daejeonella lutea]SKB74821.1 hypothetical protein SAMN05661099_2580 [Daejeonella lutea]
MAIKYLTIILLLLGTNSLAQANKTFFNELKSRKGKTFHGRVIYMPDTVTKNDFWGKNLQFTVSKVNNEIRMPFIVGENRSRTWVLRKTPDGLELKHDHRHEDGKPDTITNYGGTADKILSSDLTQYFPADKFTAALIPAAAGNRWTLQFSADKKKFFYILERDNILRFKAEFSL